MNVGTGTEAVQLDFREYLFRIFGKLSFQCAQYIFLTVMLRIVFDLLICVQLQMETPCFATWMECEKNRFLPPHTRNGVTMYSEPVFLNVYGAPELIPRNEFRLPV